MERGECPVPRSGSFCTRTRTPGPTISITNDYFRHKLFDFRLVSCVLSGLQFLRVYTSSLATRFCEIIVKYTMQKELTLGDQTVKS